jgi:hypothetical protein
MYNYALLEHGLVPEFSCETWNKILVRRFRFFCSLSTQKLTNPLFFPNLKQDPNRRMKTQGVIRIVQIVLFVFFCPSRTTASSVTKLPSDCSSALPYPLLPRKRVDCLSSASNNNRMIPMLVSECANACACVSVRVKLTFQSSLPNGSQ